MSKDYPHGWPGNPDIGAWMEARAEYKRLKALEIKAAEVWMESLTVEQQVVFSELLLHGFEGMSHLRQLVMRNKL